MRLRISAWENIVTHLQILIRPIHTASPLSLIHSLARQPLIHNRFNTIPSDLIIPNDSVLDSGSYANPISAVASFTLDWQNVIAPNLKTYSPTLQVNTIVLRV